jgi:protein ImuB
MLWIGVHLPALSLESFIATLAPEPVDAEDDEDGESPGPIALVERHRIAAANPAALACGVRPGQKRATALALAPHTRIGEADPTRDAVALMTVAHVLLAFTPAVSLAGEHVVLAEVQASLRYFGGLPRLLERLRAALAPLGHALSVACAPTAQGAHWRATGREAAPCALPADAAAWRAIVGVVPVARMAAAARHLGALQTLGLACAADLWRQPRAGLVRRFGAELLADIDRALGELADPRPWLQPPPVFDSRLELFMRADDSAALLAGAAVLLNRLTAWAGACHGLVSGFQLRLHHESRLRTRDDPTARTTVLDMALGEPVCDTAHLQALLRERLQRQPLAASVIELSLYCDAIAPGAPPNAELFPSAAGAGEGWQRLLERFEARLGAHNIQRLQPVADHRPEHATAVRTGGATAVLPSAGAPLYLEADPADAATAAGDPSHWPRLKRPVWLLPEPQPLREQGGTPLLGGRALWLVAGPERIEAGWWDEDFAEFAARDYFIAQADDGALLWVYRFRHAPQEAQAGWYLHGRFG